MEPLTIVIIFFGFLLALYLFRGAVATLFWYIIIIILIGIMLYVVGYFLLSGFSSSLFW